jgi:hypothetical protein
MNLLVIDATGERAVSLEEHDTALQVVIAQHLGLSLEAVQSTWATVGLVGGMEGVTLPLVRGELARLVCTVREQGRTLHGMHTVIVFQEYEEGAPIAPNSSFASRIQTLTGGLEPSMIGVIQTGTEQKWKVEADFPSTEQESQGGMLLPFSGQWVIFEQNVSRGRFIVPQRTTGYVVEATGRIITVQVIGHIPGALGRDHSITWTQDDAEEDGSALRAFHQDCRTISEKRIADLSVGEEIRVSGRDLVQDTQVLADDAYVAATVLDREQRDGNRYVLHLKLEPHGQEIATHFLEGERQFPLNIL